MEVTPKKQIAIIINGDTDPKTELSCDKDVRMAAKQLSQDGYEVFAASTSDSPPAGVSADHYYKSNSKNIEEMIEAAKASCDEDTEVVVLFTGHGTKNGFCTGRTCDTAVYELIDEIPYKQRTLLLDHCYAGNNLNRFTDDPRSLIIAGGGKGERVGDGHFSQNFFENEVADLNKDGEISWQERAAHAAKYIEKQNVWSNIQIIATEGYDDLGKAPHPDVPMQVKDKDHLEQIIAKLKPGQRAVLLFGDGNSKEYQKLAKDFGGNYLFLFTKDQKLAAHFGGVVRNPYPVALIIDHLHRTYKSKYWDSVGALDISDELKNAHGSTFDQIASGGARDAKSYLDMQPNDFRDKILLGILNSGSVDIADHRTLMDAMRNKKFVGGLNTQTDRLFETLFDDEKKSNARAGAMLALYALRKSLSSEQLGSLIGMAQDIISDENHSIYKGLIGKRAATMNDVALAIQEETLQELETRKNAGTEIRTAYTGLSKYYTGDGDLNDEEIEFYIKHGGKLHPNEAMRVIGLLQDKIIDPIFSEYADQIFDALSSVGSSLLGKIDWLIDGMLNNSDNSYLMAHILKANIAKMDIQTKSHLAERLQKALIKAGYPSEATNGGDVESVYLKLWPALPWQDIMPALNSFDKSSKIYREIATAWSKRFRDLSVEGEKSGHRQKAVEFKQKAELLQRSIK